MYIFIYIHIYIYIHIHIYLYVCVYIGFAYDMVCVLFLCQFNGDDDAVYDQYAQMCLYIDKRYR